MSKPKFIRERIILPIIRRRLPSMTFHHPDLEKEMEEAMKKELKKQMKKSREAKELKEDLEEFSTKFGEDK